MAHALFRFARSGLLGGPRCQSTLSLKVTEWDIHDPMSSLLSTNALFCHLLSACVSLTSFYPLSGTVCGSSILSTGHAATGAPPEFRKPPLVTRHLHQPERALDQWPSLAVRASQCRLCRGSRGNVKHRSLIDTPRCIVLLSYGAFPPNPIARGPAGSEYDCRLRPVCPRATAATVPGRPQYRPTRSKGPAGAPARLTQCSMDLNTRRVSSVRQSFQPLGVQWAGAGDHIAGLASGERGERRAATERRGRQTTRRLRAGRDGQGAVKRAGGQEVPREDGYRGLWRTGEEDQQCLDTESEEGGVAVLRLHHISGGTLTVHRECRRLVSRN